MEAIEFAVAEPSHTDSDILLATPRDVLDGKTRAGAVLDFCPRAQRGFDLAAPLACTAAQELLRGYAVLVPAELVFLPYVGEPGTGGFGSNSNGLASGNTVQEATLHGLLEVIERDVRSFEHVQPNSVLVDLKTLPPIANEQLEKILAAGLRVSVRALINAYDIPCFEANIWDPLAYMAVYFNSGYGCHLHREIALLRALTEAVQSRLGLLPVSGVRD